MIYPHELEGTTMPPARPYVVVAFQRQDAVLVDDLIARELRMNGT
jgi:hypothetical protein